MNAPEEVLRSIEYINCAVCFGSRTLPEGRCYSCAGWGRVVDPPNREERVRLGLRALWGAETIEVAQKPKKRIRLPLRKKRK